MSRNENLLLDGPEILAQTVKARVLKKKERICVHVDPDGNMHMIGARKMEERSRTLPDSWMMGVYGSTATSGQIAEDMACRMREIRG